MATPRVKRGANGKRAEAPPPEGWGRWIKGYRTQITLSIDPALLQQIDAMAHRKHLSRAALVTLWMGERLEQENAKLP